MYRACVPTAVRDAVAVFVRHTTDFPPPFFDNVRSFDIHIPCWGLCNTPADAFSITTVSGLCFSFCFRLFFLSPRDMHSDGPFFLPPSKSCTRSFEFFSKVTFTGELTDPPPAAAHAPAGMDAGGWTLPRGGGEGRGRPSSFSSAKQTQYTHVPIAFPLFLSPSVFFYPLVFWGFNSHLPN